MDKVTIKLENHGTFIAGLHTVSTFLTMHTKARMIRQCLEFWPKVFTRKELQRFDSYVLAVILNQI